MAEYWVVFARSPRRELERLEVIIARRMLSRVEALATDPRPPGCVKLQGAANLWRLRLGDYRVAYAIDENTRARDIRVVRHRSEAYRERPRQRRGEESGAQPSVTS